MGKKSGIICGFVIAVAFILSGRLFAGDVPALINYQGLVKIFHELVTGAHSSDIVEKKLEERLDGLLNRYNSRLHSTR